MRSSAAALPLLVYAATAAADPLTYQIPRRASLVNVAIEGDASVTFNPILGLPTTVSLLNGFSTLSGTPSGGGVADVGLPNAWNGGAGGIYIASFAADTAVEDGTFLFTDLFGVLLEMLPPIETPVPLVGAGFLVDILDLRVALDGPLSAPLLPVGDPNHFSWVTEGPLTVSGSLNLSVVIPGQEPISLGEPVPFSVPLSRTPVAGGFSGDAVSTTLELGVEPLAVDPDTSGIEPIVVDLGVAGNISVVLTRLRLNVDAAYTAVNRQYGLTPGGTGAIGGCGIGPELALLLPALGWLRRRRHSGMGPSEASFTSPRRLV